MEGRDREWRGSPLDMADTFRPRLGGEFKAYELHMMSTYLDSIAHSVRQAQRD